MISRIQSCMELNGPDSGGGRFSPAERAMICIMLNANSDFRHAHTEDNSTSKSDL